MEQRPSGQPLPPAREHIDVLIAVVGAVRRAAEGRRELGPQLGLAVRLLVDAAKKFTDTSEASTNTLSNRKRAS
jgi:hypothetical protein